MVRNRWLSGAIFALNCYQNKALLIVLRPASLCHIMTIRERLTQVYSLLVFLYILALLPLVKAIRAAVLGVL